MTDAIERLRAVAASYHGAAPEVDGLVRRGASRRRTRGVLVGGATAVFLAGAGLLALPGGAADRLDTVTPPGPVSTSSLRPGALEQDGPRVAPTPALSPPVELTPSPSPSPSPGGPAEPSPSPAPVSSVAPWYEERDEVGPRCAAPVSCLSIITHRNTGGIELALGLCNTGGVPITLSYTSGQQSEMRFFRPGDDTPVYTWSKHATFAPGPHQHTIVPGTCRFWHWRLPAVDDAGVPLPDGTEYVAEARSVDAADSTGPVTVTFTP